jgi:hypothetical protein
MRRRQIFLANPDIVIARFRFFIFNFRLKIFFCSWNLKILNFKTFFCKKVVNNSFSLFKPRRAEICRRRRARRRPTEKPIFSRRQRRGKKGRWTAAAGARRIGFGLWYGEENVTALPSLASKPLAKRYWLK